MSIGKINLFLLKLLNLFLALHQKCRTTIPSFLFSRTEKRKMRLHRIFLLLKNNDWRRSPAERSRIAKEPHLLVWFFAWWRQQNSNL